MIQSNVMPFRGSGIMKKQKKWYVGSTFLAWCSWDVGGKKKLLHDWTTGDTQDSDQGAGGNFRSHGYTSLSRGLYLSIKQKIMHNFLTHYKFSGGRGIIWSRALMFLEDYVKDRFFFSSDFWHLWLSHLVSSIVQNHGSQSVVPKPAASASPGNLLDANSWDTPLTYWIRNCGARLSNLCFNEITRWFCCTMKFEIHLHKCKNLWLLKEEKETSIY